MIIFQCHHTGWICYRISWLQTWQTWNWSLLKNICLNIKMWFLLLKAVMMFTQKYHFTNTVSSCMSYGPVLWIASVSLNITVNKKSYLVLNSWTGRSAAVISTVVRVNTVVNLDRLLSKATTSVWVVSHKNNYKTTAKGELQNSLSANVCKDLNVWN